MSDQQLIRLEPFEPADFDTLISWVENEKQLIQFAGPVFTFPLTKTQLTSYLADPNRYAFKVIHNSTNSRIGHGEVYLTENEKCKICRILIGDKNYRRKGYGTLLTKLLTEWSFNHLAVNSIHLNVYDFNHEAINSYTKVGFRITGTNPQTIQATNESWQSIKMAIEREEFFEKKSDKTLGS